jgi:23S rRNA (uracil1939-C5)-methyltransferase
MAEQRRNMPKTVSIEKIVYGGEGLGRLADGRAVFVPFVLPGEKVQIELTEEKARFARGLANVWLQTSADRIAAECPYFSVCGGCHYQHMPYELQLETKLETLRDQLSRIGGVDATKVSEITASPQPWAYRNQIQMQLNEDGEMGYVRADYQGIVAIQSCPIAMQGLNELLDKLELDPESGISRVSFREDSFGERFILLEGEDELPPEMTIELDASLGYLNSHQHYYHLAGNDQLHYQILGKELSLSPESFFQVNTPMAELLVEHVVKLVEQSKPYNLLELYSGAGLFSVFLAEKVSHLIAIESAPSACYDFANNLDAFENVSLYEGPVEQVLPELLPGLKADMPDLVLLDPPRAGLHPKALDALVKLAPKNIVYVSCDPSTLARDLKRLAQQGYEVETIHAFDMFPQTFHVETMTVLRRTQRVTS